MDTREEELMADMATFGKDENSFLSIFAVFHEEVMFEVESGSLKLPENVEDKSAWMRDVALDRMSAAELRFSDTKPLTKSREEVAEEIASELDPDYVNMLETV